MDIYSERTVTGLIVISAIVTDGGREWREHRRFIDYSEEEARELFAAAIAAEGWAVV